MSDSLMRGDDGTGGGTPYPLGQDPDWYAAAEHLLQGLASLPEGEARAALLERVCRRFGDALYPAFLHLLLNVQHYGDEQARALMASTLVEAMLAERLPAGALPAWGSSTLASDNPFGQRRLMGPVEFMCAWYAQPSNLTPPGVAQFESALDSLLELLRSHPRAEALYRERLQAQLDDPLGGAFSNRTRDGLQALVNAWTDDTDADAPSPATAFLDAVDEGSLLESLGSPRGF